jgi:hypothetical protein
MKVISLEDARLKRDLDTRPVVAEIVARFVQVDGGMGMELAVYTDSASVPSIKGFLDAHMLGIVRGLLDLGNEENEET